MPIFYQLYILCGLKSYIVIEIHASEINNEL
jgi:hypothetical protein